MALPLEDVGEPPPCELALPPPLEDELLSRELELELLSRELELPLLEEGALSRELELLLLLLLLLLEEGALSCELELLLLEDGALSCELELLLLLLLLLLLDEGALSCELEPPLDARAATAGLPEASSSARSAEKVRSNVVLFIPATLKQRSWSLRFSFNSNRAFMFDLLFRSACRCRRSRVAQLGCFPRERRRHQGRRLKTSLEERPGV